VNRIRAALWAATVAQGLALCLILLQWSTVYGECEVLQARFMEPVSISATWRAIQCEATVNGVTVTQGGDVTSLIEAGVLVAVAFVLTMVAAVMSGRSSRGQRHEVRRSDVPG